MLLFLFLLEALLASDPLAQERERIMQRLYSPEAPYTSPINKCVPKYVNGFLFLVANIDMKGLHNSRRLDVMRGVERLSLVALQAHLRPLQVEIFCSALAEAEESLSYRDSVQAYGFNLDIIIIQILYRILLEADIDGMSFFYPNEIANRLSRLLDHAMKLGEPLLMKGIMDRGDSIEQMDLLISLFDEMMSRWEQYQIQNPEFNLRYTPIEELVRIARTAKSLNEVDWDTVRSGMELYGIEIGLQRVLFKRSEQDEVLMLLHRFLRANHEILPDDVVDVSIGTLEEYINVLSRYEGDASLRELSFGWEQCLINLDCEMVLVASGNLLPQLKEIEERGQLIKPPGDVPQIQPDSFLNIRMRNLLQIWEYFPEPFEAAYWKAQGESELKVWGLIRNMGRGFSLSNGIEILVFSIGFNQNFQINILEYLSSECLGITENRFRMAHQFIAILSPVVYKRVAWFESEASDWILKHDSEDDVGRLINAVEKFKLEKIAWFSQARMGSRFPLDILFHFFEYSTGWNDDFVRIISSYSVNEFPRSIQRRFPTEIWHQITESAYPRILLDVMDNERFLKSRVFPFNQGIIADVSSILSKLALLVAKLEQSPVMKTFRNSFKAYIARNIQNKRIKMTLYMIDRNLSDCLVYGEFDEDLNKSIVSL